MKRRTTGLLALVAAVTLLTGCGIAAPAPSPSHSASHSPAPSASPSPAAKAGWIYPITCAQLLPLANLEQRIVATVSVQRDETSTPATSLDATLAQGGGLECVWGGTRMTGAIYEDGLTLTILPNAAAAYGAWKASAQADPNVCEPANPNAGWTCSGDALAGSTWVEAVFSDSRKQEDRQAAVSTFTSLLASVATKLNSPGRAAPAFQAAAGSFTGVALCTDEGAAAKIASAVGVAESAVTTIGVDDIGGPLSAAETRASVSQCAWTTSLSGDSSVSIFTVPGGAWAFSDFADSSPEVAGIGTLAPTTLSGIKHAYLGCAAGVGCEAIVDFAGSLIDVDVDSVFDSASFSPIIQRLVTSLATK